MDTLDSEKTVKRIILDRSRTKVDADDLEKDSSKCTDHEEKRYDNDSLQVSAFPSASNLDKPYMMPLLPIPNVERYYLNASLILTGTACKGGTGPPVGAVDIGVSKSAYYFDIALPEVKKDPGQFSCEIERDGRVSIKGVTSTCVKTVSKYSQNFFNEISTTMPTRHQDPSRFASVFQDLLIQGCFHRISDLMASLKPLLQNMSSYLC